MVNFWVWNKKFCLWDFDVLSIPFYIKQYIHQYSEPRACLSSNTGLNLSFRQPALLHAQSAMETCSGTCLHPSWTGCIFCNTQVLFQTCCWDNLSSHEGNLSYFSAVSLDCGVQPVPLFKSSSNISSFLFPLCSSQKQQRAGLEHADYIDNIIFPPSQHIYHYENSLLLDVLCRFFWYLN